MSASISSSVEREPGELRDVLDVGAGEGMIGHDARRYLYGSSLLSGNSHHSPGAGVHSGIGIDAVDRARGQALVATAAELGHDHDVGAVVEDRAELRRAVAQARVAVDALRHLDAQRRVLPLRVALVRRDALEPRPDAMPPSVGQPLPTDRALDAAPRRSATIRAAAGSTAARREEAPVADKYAFLSDAWFDAAEKLIDEHEPDVPPARTS